MSSKSLTVTLKKLFRLKKKFALHIELFAPTQAVLPTIFLCSHEQSNLFSHKQITQHTSSSAQAIPAPSLLAALKGIGNEWGAP
jgi:hypothetical protein